MKFNEGVDVTNPKGKYGLRPDLYNKKVSISN